MRKTAYLQGCYAALAKFGAATPPGKLSAGAPAPKFQSAATPASGAPKPSLPSAGTAGPLKMKLPATNVKAPGANTMPASVPHAKVMPLAPQAATAQQAAALKLSEWSLRPQPKLPPGRIAPDNGQRVLGTNFDQSASSSMADVNQAWNQHRVQRNSDPINLNSLNEGVVPEIGA